jgi:hypothetical protein
VLEALVIAVERAIQPLANAEIVRTLALTEVEEPGSLRRRRGSSVGWGERSRIPP